MFPGFTNFTFISEAESSKQPEPIIAAATPDCERKQLTARAPVCHSPGSINTRQANDYQPAPPSPLRILELVVNLRVLLEPRITLPHTEKKGHNTLLTPGTYPLTNEQGEQIT